MSDTELPCAYCGKPTPASFAAGAPWDWPGKGKVVNCFRCAGLVARVETVDCGDMLLDDEGDFEILEVNRQGDEVTLDLALPSANDVVVRTVTFPVGTDIRLTTRGGW